MPQALIVPSAAAAEGAVGLRAGLAGCLTRYGQADVCSSGLSAAPVVSSAGAGHRGAPPVAGRVADLLGLGHLGSGHSETL